jgi:hypothetical protein
MEAHRISAWAMKGNDLRYNVYLKKMNKLMRMGTGLDVEAFKDFSNTLEFLKETDN